MRFYSIFLYVMFFSFLFFEVHSDTKPPIRKAPQNVNSQPQQTQAPVRDTIYVDYNSNPVYLSRGQKVHPLCDKPASLECVAQWSQQAVPLLSQPGAALLPSSSFYMPTFVPQSQSEANPSKSEIGKDLWKRLKLARKKVKGDDGDKEDVVFYRDRNNPDRIRRVGRNLDEEGNIIFIDEEYISGVRGSFVINKDTYALPGSWTETKGCLIIKKETDQTEGGYCDECQSGNSNPVKELIAVDQEVKRRITHKKVSINPDHYEKQICDPETSLNKIIKNFNDTCKGRIFEDYFKESYCYACEHRVPIEIMMAMVTLETAGECNLPGTSGNNETSIGLGQININCHNHPDDPAYKDKKGVLKQCLGYEREDCPPPSGSCPAVREKCYSRRKLRKCLDDYPHYNFISSIMILKNDLKSITSSSTYESLLNKTPSCEKKSWLKLSSKERDYWRRTVSAYNGGAKRVQKANAKANRKGVDSNWENIRQIYFSKGLINRWTLSNVAHTEAILGREVATGHPSFVEIWHQYKEDFLEKNGGSIKCGK